MPRDCKGKTSTSKIPLQTILEIMGMGVILLRHCGVVVNCVGLSESPVAVLSTTHCQGNNRYLDRPFSP